VAPDQKVYQANFETSLTEETAAGGYAVFGAPLADGRLALGGFGFSPQIVDPLSGTTTELAAETGGFSCFTTTPSGDLITGGRQGDVKLWSGKTGQLLRTFPGLNKDRVTALSVSPDGEHLVACDGRGSTLCWELVSGDISARIRGGVSVLAFQQNDRFYRGEADKVTLHSLSGEVIDSWEIGGSTIAIDASRQRIASGSNKVGEISLTNKREAVLFQDFSSATALLYDSGHLLVGTGEGTLYRWDYTDPKSKPELLTTLEKEQIIWSILPGDTSWTLLTSRNGYGELVEISKSGEIGRRVRYPGQGLRSLALTPGGRVMARGHNYTLQFYDKESGKKLGSLVGVKENEGWVALETDGHFDGNSDGLQTISFELAGEVFKVDQFLQEYLLPGSLGRLLGDASQATMKRTAPALTSSTLKKPPKVSVLEPASGAVVQGGTLEVKIAVSDQGGGVGKLTLSHNGHQLPDSQIRSLGEGKFEAIFPPVRGVNEISVTAFEATNSVESRADRIRVTAPNVEERTPRLHLLSIGIDKYQAGLALNLAAVDSESISKQFSSDLYAPGTRLHLTNEAASLEGIQNAVNQIAEKADPQDAFVFYLAGHGTVVGETYYFLPYDVKVETDETLVSSSISSEDLAEALRNVPATKQLLILDSCKSGAAVGVVGRYYAARSGLEEIRSQQLLAKSSGTFLIAATKADDYAYEIPELGHGVLTFAILEALGKTGAEKENLTQLTVNDLLRSVSSRVPALSQKYQGVNQQVLQYSSGQDFLLEDNFGKK
ncbi:MAG: caspase family protein, partial [Candidatus Eremiobacteraeota bacterium]|nr:caspase family protein [Candidatus Eremiobacteraeota bacterium]